MLNLYNYIITQKSTGDRKTGQMWASNKVDVKAEIEKLHGSFKTVKIEHIK